MLCLSLIKNMFWKLHRPSIPSFLFRKIQLLLTGVDVIPVSMPMPTPISTANRHNRPGAAAYFLKWNMIRIWFQKSHHTWTCLSSPSPAGQFRVSSNTLQLSFWVLCPWEKTSLFILLVVTPAFSCRLLWMGHIHKQEHIHLQHAFIQKTSLKPPMFQPL